MYSPFCSSDFQQILIWLSYAIELYLNYFIYQVNFLAVYIDLRGVSPLPFPFKDGNIHVYDIYGFIFLFDKVQVSN